METFSRLATTLIILLLCCASIDAQDLKPPDWMLGLNETIETNHFPNKIDAVRIITKNDTVFYWKHNTSVMNVHKEDIIVDEAGAYIYINNKWTLRVKYTRKEFSKLFNCPKGILKPLQPYIFVNNWRTGEQLYGGFALWYFKGKDKNGNDHFGYKTLYTSDKIYTTINN